MHSFIVGWNSKHRNLFLAVFIFVVFMLPSVQAVLQCSVKQGCGETDVFHMYSWNNAHAELPTQTAYTYKLCCSGVPDLGTNCNAAVHDVLFKLNSTTNSHVEINTLSNYQNDVCLSASEGIIDCDYVASSSECSSRGGEYTCVAKMSGNTNAHVSNCSATNDYYKVCCAFKDMLPPATTISPAGSAWTNSDVSFTLTCADSGEGCRTTYSKIIESSQTCTEGGFSTGNSGTVTCGPGSVCQKKVCYYSADNSGNAEAIKTSNVFRIDKQAPVTTDNSDNEWHGIDYGLTINLTCSDTGSGCNKTYYCIYNEGEAICNPSIESSVAITPVLISCDSGICRKIIRYYSTDRVGNAESPPKNSTTILIDTSLPTCIMGSLKEYTNSTSINLSWSASNAASGSPVTGVAIEKNESGTWVVLQNFMTTSGSYIFSGQSGQLYSFRCVATNAAGKGGYSTNVKTTVDTDPPSGVSVQAQPIANTTFTVSWSGNDAVSGIANYTVAYKAGSVQYALWGNFDSQTTSAVFGQGNSPLAVQNNVTYKFKVTATDNAGNSRESAEISVLVDTGKPNCTVVSMPEYQTSNSFTVSWSGTEGESGIKEYVVEQRTGNSPAWTSFYKGGAETSKDVTGANDGIYRFRCRAIDNASNMGDFSREKNTTVDTSPPEIQQIDFNGSVNQNENLTIKATITDITKVSSVILSYSNTILNETNVSRNPNLSVWDVTWVISNFTAAGMKSFTVTVRDVNGNTNSTDYGFLVKLCDEGTTQKCGACGSGTKTCRNGVFGECVGQNTSLAKPEVCNGLDDDCLGVIDDIGGSTDPAITHCACTNKNATSIPEIQVRPETCNGIDDNCNGYIDENGGCCSPEGKTQSCGVDIGICKSKQKTCADQKWGPCEWEQGPNPQGEICGNNLDDDCDGRIDEDCENCTDNDGDGYGSPASNKCTYSEEDCDDSDPNVNPGMQEICNGKDDNCNGEIDEGLNCDHCTNGVMDEDEEGVDCGGKDCPACFVWGWLFLTAGGVAILTILAFVWFHFRRQGRELTWDELKKKWMPG